MVQCLASGVEKTFCEVLRNCDQIPSACNDTKRVVDVGRDMLNFESCFDVGMLHVTMMLSGIKISQEFPSTVYCEFCNMQRGFQFR